MDRFKLISNEYSLLMHTFSSRTIDNLKHQTFFRVLMPVLSKFLDENVEKEIRKDSLAIKLIFNAYQLEKKVSPAEFESIIEKTKKIDQEFLTKTRSLPLSLTIPYDEIEGLRKKRMELIAKFVCTILNHWMDEESLYSAIRLAFKKEEFKKIILKILHLYNLETEVLSDTVRLPLFLKKAHESISKALYNTMESAAKEIAEEWSSKVFTGSL